MRRRASRANAPLRRKRRECGSLPVDSPSTRAHLAKITAHHRVHVRADRLLVSGIFDERGLRKTVINIGAVSAHLTPPFYGPIAASKAALASLNDAMRQEFAPLGTRVFLIEPGAMKTGIFATSKSARDAWLAQRPDVERRYRPALAAMERAFEKASADDPEVVVKAVMAALSGRQTKPRAVVGKGAGAFVLMSRLPTRLRDRLVRLALGLSEALKPAN
jgi:NAD(P)-dependent dehydrogenase (short-subunit alcohol dehydrogenase family)